MEKDSNYRAGGQRQSEMVIPENQRLRAEELYVCGFEGEQEWQSSFSEQMCYLPSSGVLKLNC